MMQNELAVGKVQKRHISLACFALHKFSCRAVTPARTLRAPTHRRPRSSGRGAAGGSGRAAPGTPLPRAGTRRCGVRPRGEQGSVSPSSPSSFRWGGIAPRSQSASPNFPGGTHLGVPTGAAGAVGTAGACHLQGAIAVELPRGRGAPQVLGPSLGAAQLLPGRRARGR